MHPAFLLLLSSPLLRWFASDHDTDGWDDIALQWLVASIVLSFLGSFLMTGYKWYLKAKAGGIIKKLTWSFRGAWFFLLAGFILVALLCFVWWLFVRDLRSVVGYSGLTMGMLLAWTLYLVFMLGFHRLFGWQRELR